MTHKSALLHILVILRNSKFLLPNWYARAWTTLSNEFHWPIKIGRDHNILSTTVTPHAIHTFLHTPLAEAEGGVSIIWSCLCWPAFPLQSLWNLQVLYKINCQADGKGRPKHTHASNVNNHSRGQNTLLDMNAPVPLSIFPD
jgi:hypothetical protein